MNFLQKLLQGIGLFRRSSIQSKDCSAVIRVSRRRVRQLRCGRASAYGVGRHDC